MEDLEYLLSNEGEKTVIFFNGFRMPLSSWDKVYPEIAKHHQVLLYNRRGVGKSNKASARQHGNQIIAELSQLIQHLKLIPPFVLIGHSLGGVYAQMFAREYNEQVSALLLVDSPHPEEVMLQQSIKPPALLNLLNGALKSVEKVFDPFKFSEHEMVEITLNQLADKPKLPNVPVSILSGSKKMPFVPERAHSLHMEYQQKLVSEFNQANHYECMESGHFPQLTEPKNVVFAIEELIKNS